MFRNRNLGRQSKSTQGGTGRRAKSAADDTSSEWREWIECAGGGEDVERVFVHGAGGAEEDRGLLRQGPRASVSVSPSDKHGPRCRGVSQRARGWFRGRCGSLRCGASRGEVGGTLRRVQGAVHEQHQRGDEGGRPGGRDHHYDRRRGAKHQVRQGAERGEFRARVTK